MRAVQEQKVRIYKDQNQRLARSRIGSPVFSSIHPSQTRRANCRSSGERAASSSAAAKFTGEADSPAEEEGILGPSRLILGRRRAFRSIRVVKTAIRFHGGTSGSNPFPPPASHCRRVLDDDRRPTFCAWPPRRRCHRFEGPQELRGVPPSAGPHG